MPRLSNERHEQFCRHYVAHGNAERACQQVGYHPDNARHLQIKPHIAARITELSDTLLKASDITAKRVMLELGRVAFSDMRKLYRPDGAMVPIHELDDDTAAAIAGLEFEERLEKETREEVDLVTGEVTQVKDWKPVRTVKVKRFGKDAALTTLAKHFKIIGDEADGVNALANALAGRLQGARSRVPLVDEVPQDEQHPRVGVNPHEANRGP
jgi:phage terminase small subunit